MMKPGTRDALAAVLGTRLLEGDADRRDRARDYWSRSAVAETLGQVESPALVAAPAVPRRSWPRWSRSAWLTR